MIDTLLNAALAKYGTGTVVAEEIGASQSEFSKFRKGDAGLKIHHLRKLFEVSDLTLISIKEKESLINAALTFANLYQEKK